MTGCKIEAHDNWKKAGRTISLFINLHVGVAQDQRVKFLPLFESENIVWQFQLEVLYKKSSQNRGYKSALLYFGPHSGKEKRKIITTGSFSDYILTKYPQMQKIAHYLPISEFVIIE